MMSELGASHTHCYTSGDPANYQLADIFSPALRRRGVFPARNTRLPAGPGASRIFFARGGSVAMVPVPNHGSPS